MTSGGTDNTEVGDRGHGVVSTVKAEQSRGWGRRGAAGQPGSEQPRGRGEQAGPPPVETVEREEAAGPSGP